jgi:hypothetical protein
MSYTITYALLFEVTLFHNYFLNSGEETFIGMSAEDQLKMLQNFDVSSFAAINPTAQTREILKNHKMVFKKTKTGFRVYIKVKDADETVPFITLASDLTLQFLIKNTDHQFENYTDLNCAPHQIILLSNVRPETEPIAFHYIPKMGDNELISNDFIASAETTTAVLESLQPGEKNDINAIISLQLQGDNSSGNIVNNLGSIVSPNFSIHFDNRKTLWKYIDRKAATEIETNTAKPLTRYGFVEIDPTTDFTPSQPEDNQYPNPSVKSILKINSDYYSEIFI